MIKYDLNERVAVVTGGAQGFGLAVTERFIEAGAKVVIWDILFLLAVHNLGETENSVNEKPWGENNSFQVMFNFPLLGR